MYIHIHIYIYIYTHICYIYLYIYFNDCQKPSDSQLAITTCKTIASENEN